MDVTTLNFERARFVRVCVEVNLMKPLKGSVMINGERYYVSYEGLNNICSTCGMYGHMVHSCPRREVEKVAVSTPINVVSTSNEKNQENDGFTVVRRAGRRSSPPVSKAAGEGRDERSDLGRNLREISGNQNRENIVIANRFGSLEENMVSPEIREVAVSREGDKENANIAIPVLKEKCVFQVKESTAGGVSKPGRNNTGENSREKRVSGPKVGAHNGLKPIIQAGPKSKQPKNYRPVRGLVFGPTREEQVMSESGKRLRVETGVMGRPGGVFSGNREGALEGSNRVQATVTDMNIIRLEPEDESRNGEMEMQSNPPEEEVGATTD